VGYLGLNGCYQPSARAQMASTARVARITIISTILIDECDA
jgi:hypothetical protein